MKFCVITFRSITPAQRGESVLRRAGMECSVQRTPKWMGQRGCGYALQVRRQEVASCVAALQQEQAPFSKVFCQHADGQGEEMVL